MGFWIISTNDSVYIYARKFYFVEMSNVRCKLCDKEFYAKPFWLKKGWGKYCSAACQHAGMRSGEEKSCEICGVRTYKSPKNLARSKSGKFFCGKSCQTIWRNKVFVGEKHGNFTTGRYSYRDALRRHGIPKRCKLCKTADTRVLAVHHIDKNRENNRPGNLAWLCHNCHFLVHHYKDAREQFMATMV